MHESEKKSSTDLFLKIKLKIKLKTAVGRVARRRQHAELGVRACVSAHMGWGTEATSINISSISW